MTNKNLSLEVEVLDDCIEIETIPKFKGRVALQVKKVSSDDRIAPEGAVLELEPYESFPSMKGFAYDPIYLMRDGSFYSK